MPTKEQAYTIIAQLAERFEDQIDNYKKNYNETQTRLDFINPFFEALGWDMNNKAGAWEAYREVIHEDKLKAGAVTAAPDYSFRLVGGQRLFFVEAKRPSVFIKDDITPAYQVRVYGWNAKLAISVVTDFEEFAVYQCNKKPLRTDKASTARINYFTYKDYLKEFDFFWNTFSKEEIIKGGLIKFQRSDKKGTATVDKDFLDNLDLWRKELAANIYKNNPDISEDDLNFSVQQTIDRIIFLRIAEDRGLEPYGQLKSCLQNQEQYKELYRQFRIADDKYNSGLFHFKKEKDNSKEPDNISGKLIIENKVIKSIISSLYPPLSDYLFNVLPVEILGSAYEQFLGKQIIVKGSRATIEEKPEVRKAGGVYYTPQYIVEYIVENTVGKLCAGKTPKEISKLKIVDPACGSGSFLLGAYQYLLTWHIKYYADNKQTGKQKEAVLTPDGRLTTAEKKRILINNLYGVDIDRNAVEVTKLSLLLKCMEGETTASVNTQMTFFNERVLPSLENNIKSGNSLVDVDFYDTEFDFGEEKKIKPFSWQQGFPEVFKQGGFDAVIGNPPYVIITNDLFSIRETNYLNRYEVAQYKVDLYHLFIQKGLAILCNKGELGYILPSTWMTQQFTEKLRKYVLEKSSIIEIFHFEFHVFEQADVFTELIFLKNQAPDLNHKINFKKAKKVNFADPSFFEEKQKHFLKEAGNSIDIRMLSIEGQLALKIINENKRLDEVARASLGCQAYNSSKHSKTQIQNRVYHSDRKISSEYLEELAGNDVSRYLINRQKGKWIKYGPWLHDYRTMDWLQGPRILVREITGKFHLKIQAVYTEETYCNYKTILNVSPNNTTHFSMKFLCGILNSKLLSFLFSYTSNKIEADSFPRLSVGDLKKLPIKNIDLKNKSEKSSHDEIIKYVNTMLLLNQQKQTTANSETLEQLNQRIAYTDDKINKLVYELYGLSEEEVGIVEGG